MDDVTFGRNRPYGYAWKVSGVVIRDAVIQRQSLMSMNALFVTVLSGLLLRTQCPSLLSGSLLELYHMLGPRLML